MGLFNASSTFASVVQDLIVFINICIAALIPLALVVFFIGLVRYIYEGSDTHAHEKARESILWSLIALFVLFSIWGILAILGVAFFGGTTNGSVGSYGSGTSGGSNSVNFSQQFGGSAPNPPTPSGRLNLTPQ